MEAGPRGERLLAKIMAVAAQGFKQRMPGGDPFEIMLFRCFAVRREARIATGQLRVLPTRVVLILLQAGRCATRVERVRHAVHRLQRQGRILGALFDEPRNRFGYHAPFLCPGPAFNEHVEVEFLGSQAFQRRPADGPEMTFIHVLQEPVFEVGVAQLPSVVVSEHALHVGRRQDFPHHVEHRVVIQGVADLLKLVQEAPEHSSLNGVGRHEIEDQAIMPLAVAMDAAHALFEPVRIPGNVVVEENVTTLKVDAFARGLGGHQNLNGAFAELLFGVEPGPRFFARPGLHAAVNAADAEPPRLQSLHQIVEGVFELGEEQQSLVRTVEEPLVLHDGPKVPEFRLAA